MKLVGALQGDLVKLVLIYLTSKLLLWGQKITKQKVNKIFTAKVRCSCEAKCTSLVVMANHQIPQLTLVRPTRSQFYINYTCNAKIQAYATKFRNMIQWTLLVHHTCDLSSTNSPIFEGFQEESRNNVVETLCFQWDLNLDLQGLKSKASHQG